MAEKWYKPAELAEVWGISRTMVLKLISNGKLGAMRVGNTWRVRESDKTSYEEAHYRKAQPTPPKPQRGVWQIT